ncbi:ComF family protein [Methylophaga lonarensis]
MILIDDVLTSGCTVREAAATLQKAGCQRIEVWTIARAISHY